MLFKKKFLNHIQQVLFLIPNEKKGEQDKTEEK